MPRTSLGSHMLAVSEGVMAAQLMGIRPDALGQGVADVGARHAQRHSRLAITNA
jgi:branched-subunit amino acid ABC-type transport system permease component